MRYTCYNSQREAITQNTGVSASSVESRAWAELAMLSSFYLLRPMHRCTARLLRDPRRFQAIATRRAG